MKRTTLILLVLTLLSYSNLSAQEIGDSTKIPFKLPAQQEVKKLKTAIIYTSKGELYVELFPEEAPWHVANFKFLADEGFYRNLKFYRLRKGQYIQGGAPKNNPNASLGYSLPPEFNQHKYQLGALVMTRNPDVINPERRSNSTQFRIVLERNNRLDGKYSVFGNVIGDLEVLKSLVKGDTIEEVKVFVRETPNS